MFLLRRLQTVALKRLYKFILKRILGPFLADELDLDQLDVELSKGLLHLGDLELNVAPLNDVLAAAKAKRPPNGALMKRLVQAGRVGLLLAIGGAAVAFSA